MAKVYREPNLRQILAKYKTRETRRRALARWLKTSEGRAYQEHKRRNRERVLADSKKLYEKGHEPALWDAVAFCEVNEKFWIALGIKEPKPEWLSEALIDVSNRPWMRQVDKVIRPGDVGIEKKKLRKTRNWDRDRWIVGCVTYWRTQQRPFGKQGKLRRFSWIECFKKVREELSQLTKPPEYLARKTIEKIYQRTKPRFASKTYLK